MKDQEQEEVSSSARHSNHEQGHLSLNQWIATAVAQKIGVVETAALFFRRRAGSATPDDLEPILEKVPEVPPGPEDAIPPFLADRLSRLK